MVCISYEGRQLEMLILSRCCNHNYFRFIAVYVINFVVLSPLDIRRSLGLFYLMGETPHWPSFLRGLSGTNNWTRRSLHLLCSPRILTLLRAPSFFEFEARTRPPSLHTYSWHRDQRRHSYDAVTVSTYPPPPPPNCHFRLLSKNLAYRSSQIEILLAHVNKDDEILCPQNLSHADT